MPGFYKSGNWNENNLNPLSRINWRASLVPAAAVIPAPIAYTKVVAVKKLVVGFLAVDAGSAPRGVLFTRFSSAAFFEESASGIKLSGCGILVIYCEQNRVFKAGFYTPLNTLAWNNKIRPWSILLVCTPW